MLEGAEEELEELELEELELPLSRAERLNPLSK